MTGAGTGFEVFVLKFGLRIFSMEKLRFFACTGAGVGRKISDASKTSVGVGGGDEIEEKLVDSIDLGEADNIDLGDAIDDAGESQTLIIGELVSLLLSSVLMYCIGK